ncbi:MAG TPA: hypothetical protein VF585_07915 [Chthoniobacterales bacterium]|jgi:glucosyl-3-phosphoglycerate synthase
MSDFHQRGLISTLPRLTGRSLEDIERQLVAFAVQNSIALILPCTLDDLRRPAMGEILRQVCATQYLSKIVVSINRATAADLPRIQEMDALDSRIVCLWNDDPALLHLLPEPRSGKGFNLWSALGRLLEEGSCSFAITHDTDILNYTRNLPALLAWPLLNPELGYEFVKGYYPRLSGEAGGPLFGRVTRLFVGPLLRALVRVEGHSPLLDFLDGFRYPLAGEFGAKLESLAQVSIPEGWGLEIDLLCSVHRSIAPERVAQIDLGSNYEHKHQMPASNSPNNGLFRLATEISACLFAQLQREGITLSEEFHKALRLAYARSARDTLRRYRHVSLMNGLAFDEEQELALVDGFSRVLAEPPRTGVQPLPSWGELRRTRPKWCEEFKAVLDAQGA